MVFWAGFAFAGANAGQVPCEAMRGGDEEMAAAASRIADLEVQDGLFRLVGLEPSDALGDDRLKGRIDQALH